MSRKPVKWPWDPELLDRHEISAIKAIAAQHPDGFKVILEKICGVDRLSFTAGGLDGQRASDFGEGKRWCGNTLRMIRDMKLPEPRQRETGPNAVPRGAPPGVVEPKAT